MIQNPNIKFSDRATIYLKDTSPNPNIKFSDRATIYLKDTSPNSHFFLTENQLQKSGQ